MTSLPQPTKEPSSVPPRTKKKFSLERLMIMFTLFFILGVFILVTIPEGHPARAIAMTVYSISVFWAMFKYGL